jgi:tRNA A37 methylthiotransferase MiaB
LRAGAEAKSLAFRRAMVGRVEEVAVLQARDRGTGKLTGLTGNYVEVLFDGSDAAMRGLTRIRVTGADGAGTYGEQAA